MILSENQIRRSAARKCARYGRLFVALLLAQGLAALTDAQTVETRRILALRVSFPQEIPDDETTSGDGTFDLRSFEEAAPDYRFPFDTPPHNRSYFTHHLQALAHYYHTVSAGRLVLEYTVLPAGENDSYVLERKLIDYGNGRTRQEINQRIVELFRDGILAADAQEGSALDIADFDDVIVIHAGLGGESSNALNDVPTAFINANDLDTYADGPIVVDGGTGAIGRGILLPESGGKDGRSGLNGILARFYGNQLGLPRLDNPEDGLPAVGDWSLMDTGNIIVASAAQLGFTSLTGDASDTILVAYSPSRLSAWSRAHLGWLTPVTVRQDTTITIAAAHTTQDLPRAVRIPISADEYFLLENRVSRLVVEGRRPNIRLSNETSGVWIANDDYDAFIPGSGILIWHIDDAVIAGSTDGKAVNSNIDFRNHFDGLVGQYRKGVALEEADGLDDIGNTSASRIITSGFISFSNISGNAQDLFYFGNTTRFAPDTTPSSASNLGYNSGIEIDVLSPPGETMDVSIRFGRQQNAWPRILTEINPQVAPRVATINGALTILNGSMSAESAWSILGQPHDVAGYNSVLTSAIGSVSSPGFDIVFTDGIDAALWSDGSVLSEPLTGFLGQSVTPSTAPVVATFPGSSANDIWGLSDGSVAWGVAGRSVGRALVREGQPIQGMAVGDIDGDGQQELVVVDRAGSVVAVEDDRLVTPLGTLGDVVGAPIVADLDRTGSEKAAVVSKDGTVTIFSAPGETTVSRPVDGGATTGPSAADIDRDGFVELLFGGNARVWITRFNGVGQANAPVALPLKDRAGPITSPPLIADLDSDGELDIIAVSTTGTIYAISAFGTPLPGFPILASGPVNASLLLEDLDNDNILELVAFTTDGGAHLWHLDDIDASLTGTEVIWGQAGGDAGNTSRLAQIAAVDGPQGSELIPKERAYCYPNPVRGNEAYIRYFLSEQADVDLIVVNAVGQIVDRVAATDPDIGTDNEIAWDTTDYGSGVYICRLQATNGSRTETRFIKAAVIR